ncbi:MAG: isochorismatase family protein [Alphaproteobacteria bacterium]|nr:isochorismatase family protein [Alphaproteobacteria bacterium]
MILRADSSILIVIDVQARLLPAVAEPAATVRRVALLMTAARRLGVPMLVTEQYPQGLGPTVPELAALATPEETVAKIHFSCAAEPAVRTQLGLMAPRRQAVLCGTETHVCVLQSAFGLRDAGWEVFVAADAVASRKPIDHGTGLERMGRAGIGLVTAEMVVFEWLARAATPEFRDLSRLIK